MPDEVLFIIIVLATVIYGYAEGRKQFSFVVISYNTLNKTLHVTVFSAL